MVAVVAMNLFNAATSMSPVGLIVRGIALSAGFLLANWKDIGPFFSRMWAGIKSGFSVGVDFIKTYLGWTPLGVVLNNWEPLKAFFSALWDGIKSGFSVGVDFIKTYLGWTPLGMVLNNWEPLKAFFSALWDGIKVVFDAAWQGIKFGFENFTPLGLLIKNWEPIVAYFKSLWDKVRPFIEPLMGAAKGFGGAVSGAVGQKLNSGTSVIKRATQAARAELTVNLNGAPPGTRVEQPAASNARLTVNQNNGRRSLAPTSN